MPTVRDVLNEVERLAPPEYAFSFDHVGLQLGDPTVDVCGIVTTLDCSEAAVDFATERGANVIVSHHPLIWEPVQSLCSDDGHAPLVTRLVRLGMSVIAAHTNWDCAPGGVNDTLAEKLGLSDVRAFGSRSNGQAFKLVTFAPPDNVDAIIDALAAAGAGRIGLYDRCAFVSEGQGTFRGKDGSHPVVGKIGQIESVAEVRIEMIVPELRKSRAVRALREAHPYEEPAIDLIRLDGGAGHPIGRIGELAAPLSQNEFLERVAQRLGSAVLAWGNRDEVRHVAVVGGAADSEWDSALSAGAQAYVTGEVKHHIALEAASNGLLMVQAGHYATEHPGMVAFAGRLSQAFPNMAVEAFEPRLGQGGRPL